MEVESIAASAKVEGEVSASRPERRAAILAELEAVCAGPVFAKSPALTRLLRFLVERELAGEAAHLRETYIGSALYGRDRDYDPKIDGIVRVNANRLRTRLEEQYWKYPASRVQFVLQRGSYVPFYRFIAPEHPVQPEGLPEAVAKPLDGSVGAVPLPLPAAGAKGKPLWVWGAAALVVACLGLVWAMRLRRDQAAFLWTSRPLLRFGGAQEFPAFSPDGGGWRLCGRAGAVWGATSILST